MTGKNKQIIPIRLLALAGLCCFAAMPSWAQSSGKGVGDEKVVVVKEYEAKIQDAQKINLPPDIPETEEKKHTFSYSVPARDYKKFAFVPNPLRPIALSKEKAEKYNGSYIKLGFGSQLTPLAELAYNDNKTKNLKFGLFYDHLSSRGIKIKNQRFVDDRVGTYLRYFPKAMELGTAFTFHNYRTHFYSVDTMFADTVFTPKQVRQVFRDYDARLYLRNAQKTKHNINFEQSLRFNYFQERFGKANEWFAGGNTFVAKSFLEHHEAFADFDIDISRLKNDSLTLQRNLFRFDVGYRFDNDDWDARGKIGLAIDGKKVFLLADAYVEKRLYRHLLIAYVGYKLRYDKNSLRSFAQTNNFIYNYVPVKNAQIGDLALGLKGSYADFSYNAAFHLNHCNVLPLFVNDTLDMRRFEVIYDTKVTVFSLHAEAGYQIKEWLRLSLSGDYNFYKMNTEQRAWQEPALQVTFQAQYIWKNKIKAGIALYGITNTYAKLAGGREALIKGTGDLNLSLEYIMSKHFSFFGNLNNIAHRRYQRWYGYPSYGINGLVGAKFSF